MIGNYVYAIFNQPTYYYNDYPNELEMDVKHQNLGHNYLIKLIELGIDVFDLIGRGVAVSRYGTPGPDESSI